MFLAQGDASFLAIPAIHFFGFPGVPVIPSVWAMSSLLAGYYTSTPSAPQHRFWLLAQRLSFAWPDRGFLQACLRHPTVACAWASKISTSADTSRKCQLFRGLAGQVQQEGGARPFLCDWVSALKVGPSGLQSSRCAGNQRESDSPSSSFSQGPEGTFSREN